MKNAATIAASAERATSQVKAAVNNLCTSTHGSTKNRVGKVCEVINKPLNRRCNGAKTSRKENTDVVETDLRETIDDFVDCPRGHLPRGNTDDKIGCLH